MTSLTGWIQHHPSFCYQGLRPDYWLHRRCFRPLGRTVPSAFRIPLAVGRRRQYRHGEGEVSRDGNARIPLSQGRSSYRFAEDLSCGIGVLKLPMTTR